MPDVASSVLFDEEWYAAQTGLAFGSRADAAAHYVAHAAESGATPHPLFEPAWLYPAHAWRATASDPLSHYLARADRADLSTHPLLPDHAEDWLHDAGPDTRLPRTTGLRVTYAQVRTAALSSIADPDADATADRCLRSTSPSCCPSPTASGGSAGGCAGSIAPRSCAPGPPSSCWWWQAPTPTDGSRRSPRCRSPAPASSRSADRAAGAVTVVADPALEPPDWPWLHHLVDRLADPSVGRVGPLLVEADQTVVSAGALPAPFLRGETPADAARAAHLPVPDLGPGVVAFRTADGPRDPAYVVPDARVVVPPSRAGRAAAEERRGRVRPPRRNGGGRRASRVRADRCASSRAGRRCAGRSTSRLRWPRAAGAGATTPSPGAWPRPWSGAVSG